LALPAKELEERVLALIRTKGSRHKIKGIAIVYIGEMGCRPNWFARPLPPLISDKCMKEFVSAFSAVRKEYDLLSEAV
jgi:hypothetical protein